MCLAIYSPVGEPLLPKSVFRNAWGHNYDGAGYMFALGGKLIIRKPFWSLKALWKAYRRDFEQYGTSSPFVIHFRYSTHGVTDTLNTHPHSLNDGEVGLVHNGVLWDFEGSNTKLSDTVFFCQTVLAQRTTEQLTDEKFGQWLTSVIGGGNKLVLMDHQGGVLIVNPGQGVWDGQVWYSNTDYLAPVKKTVPSKGGEAMFYPPGYQPTAEDYAEMRELGLFDAKVNYDDLDEEQWKLACNAMERDADFEQWIDGDGNLVSTPRKGISCVQVI